MGSMRKKPVREKIVSQLSAFDVTRVDTTNLSVRIFVRVEKDHNISDCICTMVTCYLDLLQDGLFSWLVYFCT